MACSMHNTKCTAVHPGLRKTSHTILPKTQEPSITWSVGALSGVCRVVVDARRGVRCSHGCCEKDARYASIGWST